MGERIITINKQKIDAQGPQYYEKIKSKLEASEKGKIIAINPDNGDYFLGDTVLEAVRKGREKYPDCVFYLVKVGYSAVYSFHRKDFN